MKAEWQAHKGRSPDKFPRAETSFPEKNKQCRLPHGLPGKGQGSVDATQTSTAPGNCLSSLRTADTVFPETPVLGICKSEQLLINKVFFYWPDQGLSSLNSFPF